MSHHILHVLKHGCVLSKDRGFLVCRGDDKTENRIPHEDVRAVVIAARGVTLTSCIVTSVINRAASPRRWLVWLINGRIFTKPNARSG
jgi:CRISPR/Cas system-associated endonuclease Cas1